MSNDNTNWIVVERPGYFGKTREDIHQLWDEAYEFQWRLAWQFGDKILSMGEALIVCEDAYFDYFTKKPKVTKWLTDIAFNVYDTHPSNVDAGLEYKIDDTPRNHIFDIAIRRSLNRLGQKFNGNELIQIGSYTTKGYIISPGVVPFHRPELIYNGDDVVDHGGKPSCIDGAIECFYHRNKLLQVKEQYFKD